MTMNSLNEKVIIPKKSFATRFKKFAKVQKEARTVESTIGNRQYIGRNILQGKSGRILFPVVNGGSAKMFFKHPTKITDVIESTFAHNVSNTFVRA
jgi:hypothetical protein